MEPNVWESRKNFVFGIIEDDKELRAIKEKELRIAFTCGYDYAMRSLNKALENITELKDHIEQSIKEQETKDDAAENN